MIISRNCKFNILVELKKLYKYAIIYFNFLINFSFSDCLHLQLYRDSKDRYKQGQTKASLSLEHFLGLETGFTLDKESNTVAILCQDVVVVLAFDNRERLMQWQVRFFRFHYLFVRRMRMDSEKFLTVQTQNNNYFYPCITEKKSHPSRQLFDC